MDLDPIELLVGGINSVTLCVVAAVAENRYCVTLSAEVSGEIGHVLGGSNAVREKCLVEQEDLHQAASALRGAEPTTVVTPGGGNGTSRSLRRAIESKSGPAFICLSTCCRQVR